MENGLDDNVAELAAEMENFVSDLMMQPDREQVASEIGGEYILMIRFLSSLGRSFLSQCYSLSMEIMQSISGMVRE